MLINMCISYIRCYTSSPYFLHFVMLNTDTPKKKKKNTIVPKIEFLFQIPSFLQVPPAFSWVLFKTNLIQHIFTTFLCHKEKTGLIFHEILVVCLDSLYNGLSESQKKLGTIYNLLRFVFNNPHITGKNTKTPPKTNPLNNLL